MGDCLGAFIDSYILVFIKIKLVFSAEIVKLLKVELYLLSFADIL